MTPAAQTLPATQAYRGRNATTRPVTRKAPRPTPHGWRESNLPLRVSIGELMISRQLSRLPENELPDETA